MRFGSGAVVGAVLGLCVAVTVVTPWSPGAARADTTYPSWAQVQAAMANQASAQAAVTQIDGLITQLQSNVVSSGTVEIQKAAAYGQAEAALAAATKKADLLSTKTAAAKRKAAELRQRSGLLESELWRAGGTDLSARVFFSGSHATTLLDKLGSVTRLTAQANGLFTYAKQASNEAAALSAQASAAQKARTDLDAAAQKAFTAAQAAQKAANQALADQQQHQSVMVAQLATLKNTTVQVEQQYAQGVAVEAAYEADISGSVGSDSFAPPPGVVVNPAAAQAYAASQIGRFGWGGSQMQCLVWLWTRESGWRADAYNTSSGAYGIPQSLPAGKMAVAGADWATNGDTQINWGLAYIKSAYGSPCQAWAHETAHSWY